MSYINFDYFVERGVLLTEMARPVSLTGINNPPPELLNAYQKLRTYIKSHYGINNSSSIDLFAFRCIYYIIEKYLSRDEQSVWESMPKQSSPVKNLTLQYLNKVMVTKPESVSEVIEGITNPEKIEELRIRMMQTVKHQNRSEGKDKQFSELTGMGRDEFRQLTFQLEPFIKKMNSLMRAKRTSITRVGDRSKFLQKTETENVNPNIQTATDISTILSEMSAFREKLRSSGDLDSKEETSMWASKDPSNQLKLIMKAIPDKIFEAYIGNLMITMEEKIEGGTGQSITGFLKLVDAIKKQPNSPKAINQLFNLIVQRIQSNSVEDIYQSQEDTNQFEGYDSDVINKVLETPEQKSMFSEWLRARKAEREALDAELNRRYEDKISNLVSQLKGDTPGVDTNTKPKSQKNPWKKKIDDTQIKIQDAEERLQNADPAYANELKKSIARMNAELDMYYQQASDWQPVQESVFSYMEEQTYRDSKTNTKGKFVDKGYRKFDNYGKWIMFND